MTYRYMTVNTITNDEVTDFTELNRYTTSGWRVIDVRHWANEYIAGIDFILEKARDGRSE